MNESEYLAGLARMAHIARSKTLLEIRELAQFAANLEQLVAMIDLQLATIPKNLGANAKGKDADEEKTALSRVPFVDGFPPSGGSTDPAGREHRG